MKKIRQYLVIALFYAIGFFVVSLVIDLCRGRFATMFSAENFVVSILFGIMMALFDFNRWYKGKQG